jgi:hypothetical protein
MRNGQNKRMRGRNRKGQNPMSRVFESNGPDVKIRGTPSHIAEKYLQLARDAQTSGDPVAAENYYQHAEHYFRLIAAAQEQFRQNNPQFYRPDNEPRDMREDAFDDGDDMGGSMGGSQPMSGPGEAPFGHGEPQPYLARDAQPYPVREQPVYAPRPQPPAEVAGDIDRLPSFITGGQPPQAQPTQSHQGYGPNGHENQGDRFPLHRRRRRHRGPRHDMSSMAHSAGDSDDSSHGGE